MEYLFLHFIRALPLLKRRVIELAAKESSRAESELTCPDFSYFVFFLPVPPNPILDLTY